MLWTDSDYGLLHISLIFMFQAMMDINSKLDISIKYIFNALTDEMISICSRMTYPNMKDPCLRLLMVDIDQYCRKYKLE